MLRSADEVGAKAFVLFQYYLTFQTATDGIKPTLKQIQKDLGWQPSATCNLRNKLAQKGWIKFTKNEVFVLKTFILNEELFTKDEELFIKNESLNKVVKEQKERKNSIKEKKSAKTKKPVVTLETFSLTTALREWAVENKVTVDLDNETEQWRDHHIGKGTKIKICAASWRTWMRNSKKYSPSPTVKTTKASDLPIDHPDYKPERKPNTFEEVVCFQGEMEYGENFSLNQYEKLKENFIRRFPDRADQVPIYERTVEYRKIAARTLTDLPSRFTLLQRGEDPSILSQVSVPR